MIPNKTNKVAILFECIFIAVIYFIFAKIGQLFAIPPGNVTPVWIPSGIIFAWVFIRGYYVWPGIFLGAFAGNVWAYIDLNTFSNLSESLLAGSLNGFGDALCAIVGVFLIRHFLNSDIKLFSTVKSVIFFIIFGAIFGSAISAIFGVTGLVLSGFIQWQTYIYVWITWFIGDTAGVVVFAPLIIVAKNWVPFINSLTNNKKYREFVLYVLLMAVLSYTWILLGNTQGLLYAPYAILFIFLIWSVFRFEGCVTYYTVFFTSILFVIYHLFLTPEILGSITTNLVLIDFQLLVIILYSSILILSSIVFERKQSEKKLKKYRDDLKALVKELQRTIDSLPHPFYVIDINTFRILQYNKACEEMGDSISGMTCHKLTHNNDLPCSSNEHICPLNEVKRTGKPIVVEHIHADKSGNKRVYEIHGYPIFNEDLKIIQMIEYSLDITDRKKAELELAENEKRLSAILDTIQTGVVIIDAENHNITDINNYGEKLIGLPKNEIVGHVCHEYICPAEVDKCPITDLGFKVDNSEKVLIDTAGQNIPIIKSVTKLMLNGKEFLVEAFVDIRQRKKAEADIRDLAKFPEENINPVFRVSNEGVLLFANTACMNLIFSRNIAVGDVLPDLWQKKISTSIITGKKETSEFEINGKIYSFDMISIINLGYINVYGEDITIRKKLQQELDEYHNCLEETINKKTSALKERVKELDCLYKIGEIVEIPDITLSRIYQETVRILRLSLQYPELSNIFLKINSTTYKTDSLRESKYKREFSIKVGNNIVGSITVYLLHELTPSGDKLTLLPEEFLLIDAVAERIGRITERMKTSDELEKANVKLERLVFIDALTGLINRKPFIELLEREIGNCSRMKQKLALLFLDLENFKTINDVYGHKIGDLLLKEAAQIFLKNTRSTDYVGRIGGDEFVIYNGNIKSTWDVTSLAEKINNSFSVPLFIDGIELKLGVSIGISLYPQDGDNASDLLKTGDLAMYKAKKKARNSYYLFNEDLNNELFFDQSLKKALNKREFKLYFQPIVDKNGNLYSSEVLLRWENIDFGLTMPVDFIPILENNKGIIRVGEWVLEEACRFAAATEKLSSTKFPVSVNVSQYQLNDDFFLDKVERIINETKVDPKKIIIEITEKTQIKNIKRLKDTIRKLKDIGIGSIALDDFGSGYSSFSSLYSLPVDIAKIDKFFVERLEDDKFFNMIQSLISLIKKSDLKVIVEGVETREQFEALKKMGCDYFQGFYFSKPVSNILDVLKSNKGNFLPK